MCTHKSQEEIVSVCLREYGKREREWVSMHFWEGEKERMYFTESEKDSVCVCVCVF